MKKRTIFLIVLFAHTIWAMEKFKNITPGANTRSLLTLAVINEIPPAILQACVGHIINPFSIVRVTKMPSLPPVDKTDWSRKLYVRENESYRVLLKNGYVAICEYKQTGRESGEIDCCLEIEKTMIPLPVENFFIAKEYYEATKLSYFKLH